MIRWRACGIPYLSAQDDKVFRVVDAKVISVADRWERRR